MLPRTGPFTKSKGGGSWRINRYVYRQAKPYNLKLPYEYYYGVTSDVTWQQALVYGGSERGPITILANGDLNYSQYISAQDRAVSSATKRLNASMGSSASLGVALAEVDKTIGMIAARGTQLFKAAKSLKSFDGRGFLDALGLSWVKFNKQLKRRSPKAAFSTELEWRKSISDKRYLSRRKRAVETSNLWLEYSFAWSPTIDDIKTAAALLKSGSQQHTSLRESAKEVFTYSTRTSVVGPLNRVETVTAHTVSIKVKVGATPIVSNQYLYDLNRLGLTNLAEVIYEVIPWSFVANYFINLDEFAKSFNANLGVSYEDPFYTVFWQDDTVTTELTYRKGVNGEPETFLSKREVKQKYISLKRVVGSLPSVRLGLRYKYSNNLPRAINNIALLAQKAFSGRP